MVEFNALNDQDKETVLHAFPLIAIYIAGADGTIDKDELAWSKKLTSIRSFAGRKDIQVIFDTLDPQFDALMQHYMDALPTDLNEKNTAIAAHLSKLNPILAGFEPHFGYRLYHNYVTYAEHIAKSSGGILGFGSVNADEDKLMGLDMIHPIAKPEKQ
jgi:hypothetical protein